MTKQATRYTRLRQLRDMIANPGVDCIEWQHAIGPDGYGRINIDGAICGVHAIACAEAHGPRPPDKPHAAHLCGNRCCVNTTHLRWATPKENAADRVLHGTDNGPPPGPRRLTEEQVAAIQQEYASDRTAMRKLAGRYGVSASLICYTIKGRHQRAA